jgi:hypothetical protein
MSRVAYHFPGLAVVFVLSASLSKPPVVGAQSVEPERALLNHTANAPRPTGFEFSRAQNHFPQSGDSESAAERALLGRVSSQAYALEQQAAVRPSRTNAQTVDGMRALLNRPTALDKRRHLLSAE